MAAVLWLSTPKMTVRVRTDRNGVIVDAAPVVRKFVGQSLGRLVGWLRKQGPVRIVPLE